MKSKIIIFHFEDKSEMTDYGYYSYIIPDSLLKELNVQGKYDAQTYPVKIGYISGSLEENEEKFNSLIEKGTQFSAKYIVIGSYRVADKKISIQTQIFDVKKRKVYDIAYVNLEIGTILVELIEDLTKRINSEFARLDKIRADDIAKGSGKKGLYGILSISSGIIAAGSLGAGFYFNYRASVNKSEYDKLALKYNAAVTEDEATSLHVEMKDEKDKFKKNLLYRNISLGVSGLSILATAFFTYKYFIYSEMQENPKISGNELFIFTPIYSYYGSNIMVRDDFIKNEHYIGAVFSFRF